MTVPAGVWSGLMIALGLWWWLRPDGYPFGRGAENVEVVLDALPPAAAGPATVAAGVVGLAVARIAAAGARRPGGPGRGAMAVIGATAAVFATVFGLLLPGLSPLTLVGYAMAMFGPLVLFGTVLAGAWRWRGGPMAVGVFVALAALAWLTGFADSEVLRSYVGFMAVAGGKVGPSALLLFLLVGGVVWGALGAVTILQNRAGRPAPAWTRPESAARWGRVAVVVAVVCALPYGLHRISWLTPWPIGMAAEELMASPATRLHGFLLGMAALAGAVLTTGLVARWGEVWPRWMPVVRGRRVPVAAAVVPGTLVAALFTVAAVPFAAAAVENGQPWMLLVFPFPLWGPALGAAVLAYALRRRGERRDLAQ